MLTLAEQHVERLRCALIWTDIGHYHAVRSKAAFASPTLHVETIEVVATSEYKEFRAPETETSAFPRRNLGLSRPLRNSAARRSIHDALLRLAPSIVFVPGWSMLESIIAIDWCATHRIPFVIMSESSRRDFSRSPAKEAIKRRIVALAGAALVGGIPHVEYVADLGMRRDQIFQGYDVVDNAYFSDAADEARANADALRSKHSLPKHYFLCSARLVEKKNILRLVKAFAAYRQSSQGSPWELIIVGPGPLEEQARQLIDALSLGHVAHLAGAKGYAVLPLYYGLAGAFILPSTTEQWGLVINEAMACGLPVLVSKSCGCSSDLVEDGRNGFTFDPFDVDAIAEAMLRAASENCDRAAMGAASRAIIADWGPARFAAGFEAAAEVALASPPRRASIIDRALLRALTFR